MPSSGVRTVLSCVLMSVVSWTAAAQTVFEPGEGVQLAVADNCATAKTGPIWVPQFARCDAQSATAGAGFRAGSINDIGNPRAAAALYNTFRVADTPETAGRYVGAWIGYDVSWKGLLQSFSIGLSSASVEVTYELTDLTAGRTIMSDLIFGKSTDGFSFGIGPIPVEVALGVNDGAASNGLPAILVRGHLYRFLIRLTCSGRLRAESGGVTCDYFDTLTGYGLNWQRLQVKLGPDDQEINDRLTELEMEVELLKRHTHEYRTGIGVGHNNTAAESSPPILPTGGTAPLPLPPPDTGVPGAPVALALQVQGATVHLSWMAAPSGAAPTRYVLEAGSGPGLRDLVPGSDLGPQTSFASGGVPPGTYYVRVRAGNAAGLGPPSSDIVVQVR